MKTFIEDFKNSPYYKRLFEYNYEIMLIYVSGSYCTHTNSKYSDYDISILVPDGEFFDAHTDFYLTYKGNNVHAYFNPISSLFEPWKSKHPRTIYGHIQLQFCFEHIIYVNSKYQKTLELLQTPFKELSKLACIETYLWFKNTIAEALKIENFKLQKPNRLYYSCLAASIYLNCLETKRALLRLLNEIKTTKNIKLLTNNQIVEAINLLVTFKQSLADKEISLDWIHKEKEFLYKKFLEE